MDTNTELLNYVYQNAQMGVDTIDQLNNIIEDKAMCDALRTQQQEYRAIHDEAEKRLTDMGHKPKGISGTSKAMTYMSIATNTLTNKSPSHIAEMMIQGSTMGIIDATKRIKQYAAAAPEHIALTDRLLKTEQNNVEQLKPFLS